MHTDDNGHGENGPGDNGHGDNGPGEHGDYHGVIPHGEPREGAFHKPEDSVFDSHEAAPSLDLGDQERLPWLEGADDFEERQRNSGHHRMIALAVVALIVLALLVDGIYWVTHRGGSSKPADGSLIEASKDPYKVAPGDPGGKKFAGTGDSSFKVSQGEHPDASLAGSAGTTPPPAVAASAAPSPAATPVPPAPPQHVAAAAPTGGGVAVQVGAYSTEALAQSAWSRLTAANELLKGLNHRVVEGKADIGTVYRLQALASDGSAATSLCSHLEADGVKCQVKR
ncbi:SPOR domain-containing protein [Novosphingobium sp.]|uniref:SPOR domain-containing protein n=1 Tax=Novosphingobium sp. TaxID=1874826 RepID=UPI003B517178